MSADIDRILREKYAARRAEGTARMGGRWPRFSPEQAAELIRRREAGESINALAREFRTSQSVIARYVREGFQPARWRA